MKKSLVVVIVLLVVLIIVATISMVLKFIANLGTVDVKLSATKFIRHERALSESETYLITGVSFDLINNKNGTIYFDSSKCTYNVDVYKKKTDGSWQEMYTDEGCADYAGVGVGEGGKKMLHAVSSPSRLKSGEETTLTKNFEKAGTYKLRIFYFFSKDNYYDDKNKQSVYSEEFIVE